MFQFEIETRLDFDVNRLALPEEQSAVHLLASARGGNNGPSGAGGMEGDDDGEEEGKKEGG
jgi:hypothetical protein